MPGRSLRWQYEAQGELERLIDRRTDRAAVLDCIDLNARLIAEEPALATVETGPSRFLVHRFECRDGDVALYIQLVFDADDPVVLYVLSCKTVGLQVVTPGWGW